MNTIQQTLLQLQDQVTNNKIAPALEQLRNIFALADSDLLNDAIMITGQYKKLTSDVRKGIIDYGQENLRHNQIMHAVLSLVEEIRQTPEAFVRYEQTQNQLANAIKKKGQAPLPEWMEAALLARIAHLKEKHWKINALWIDDEPGNHRYESEILNTLGVNLTEVVSSEAAVALLAQHSYTFVISDINRLGDTTEGLRFQAGLVESGIDLPLIFYVSSADRSLGVPPYAFGITHSPNELLHLVLDVIARVGS
jgi:CheY-like chemotaxis protein